MKNKFQFLITLVSIMLVVYGARTIITTIKNLENIITLQEKALLIYRSNSEQVDIDLQEIEKQIMFLKDNTNAFTKSYLLAIFMIGVGFLLNPLLGVIKGSKSGNWKFKSCCL